MELIGECSLLIRLETSRGGWPSIIAMGSGKEASITHNTDNAHINMTHRSTVGTGSWTEQNISSVMTVLEFIEI